MRWDIFCKVIDNHGDVGVCWRLAADLGGRGETVRLWVDDASALAWMAPQGASGVSVHAWTEAAAWPAPGDVLVEAFGCDPEPAFLASFARAHRDCAAARWVNLEYLSAEPFVERVHGLPSPVAHGPGAGLAKHFFYPGFSSRTGGLLREPDLHARQQAFDRAAWAAGLGFEPDREQLVSLFCYEPAQLPALLHQLASGTAPTRLLVTAGRAAAATRAALSAVPDPGALTVQWLPLMTQAQFDELLWGCDLNFVRGEDSLVRALWAGRPFVWQLYPQQDGAHHAKLDAFLQALAPPADWAALHRAWNGEDAGPLPLLDAPLWREAATAFRARLQSQDDLATALVRFVTRKR